MEPPDPKETAFESMPGDDPASGASSGLLLSIAWSQEHPERVAEVFVIPSKRPVVLGRSLSALRPVRRRPSGDEPCGPLTDSTMSREHLEVSRTSQSWLTLRRIGRRSVVVDGAEVAEGATVQAREGSLILIGGRLLLLVVRDEPLPSAPDESFAFGEDDEDKIVGESASAWALRYRIANFGPRSPHVLILGESGVGKELTAQALHRASKRCHGPFVSRNASMFPEGLIDAELLGNPKDYPNPGMMEREGLIKAADRGTLFLDEVAELPPELQPKLLRVMDSGEYMRIGETRVRNSDVRFLGATHRDLSALRHDLAARFQIKLEIAPLRERRSDIPLLLRHIVRAICADDPDLAPGLLNERGEPRLRAAGVAWLLRQPLPTNTRGIAGAVWDALMDWFDEDSPLDLTPPEPDAEPVADVDGRASHRRARDVSCEEVAEAMETASSLAEAVEMLRIRDRHTLQRLRKRCGLME